MIDMSVSSTVCAIVPTYNRAAMLKECLDSILALSVPFREIIVVSDGSTDDTESVVKSYGDRVMYLYKENGGKSSALNAALARCASDYVWICDDDDLAAPGNGLMALKTALDDDPALDFAFGKYLSFRDGGGTREFREAGDYSFADEPHVKIRFLEGMFTHLGTMLVRRLAYIKAGAFHEHMIRAQDYDMVIRITRSGKSVYIPQIIFFFRMHDGIKGAVADRFMAAMWVVKQREYDQKIFSRVWNEYALEEFTPAFALQWGDMPARRAALLQRALVFATRHMWDYTLIDFRTIACMGAEPVTRQELRLAEREITRLMERNLPFGNADWIHGLRAWRRTGGYGKSIVHAACRPLAWRMRVCVMQGDVRGAFARLDALVGIMGVPGAGKRLLESLLH
jgi:glycosyltransferase involved in cell wall biosynthesis